LAENSAAAEKPSFAFRLRTGKRGRAKIPSPQPPSFLPARAQIFFRIQRPDFRGKKFGFRSAFGARLYVQRLLPRRFAPRQADCIVFAKIFSVQSPPFAKAKRGSPLPDNGQTKVCEPILFIPSASGRTESKAIIFNSPKAI
jgi:hypothetical protein